ncbi:MULTISPECIES: hypothetical protein [Legionella]|uniref:WD40 domain-containing protein n=1 Tax=Legionella drozanskii LLAP-1 TaxID=1212489 RepID=A0A0W0SWM2_9GAMM|nr:MULTISPECIES: hypothetical protein [Legionella]KTC87705.1 WD40 domain-containing protein [Legionella drozanskii LLAP-1]PJE16238.1 MAG: hypothetical protein CK430_03400 [Legionella sp.]
MYDRRYEFFPKQPKNRRVKGDRDIPSRSQDSRTSDLQYAKVRKVFDQPKNKISDALCASLWNVSHQQMRNSPLRGLTLPDTYKTQPVIKKALHTLDLEEGLYVEEGISGNYYLNSLCWTSKTQVCIGLEESVLVYDIKTQQEREIATRYSITALAYDFGVLVIADSKGGIQYINSEVYTQVRLTHKTKAYTKIISDGSHGFYAASQYGRCLTHFDLRTPQRTHNIQFFDASLTGLAFDKVTGTLAISNGTTIEIFDPSYLRHPTFTFTDHKSPSKALEFSPYQRNILASGGGADDMTLKIWDFKTGAIIAKAIPKTQICNIHWLDSDSVLITEGNEHRVSCWSINRASEQLSMDCSSSNVHTDRVLLSAQNPHNKKNFATASPDQTLRFWSVDKPAVSDTEIPESYLNAARIR